MIGYLDKVIRPLVLILPKISGYVRISKIFKDGDKDKNNKFISFLINDEELLEKFNTIWTKIEDLIELNALSVYDDIYIKPKRKTYREKVYTTFCGLNVPEDDIEYESFAVFSTDSFLIYGNKYYLQVYLHNCPYKIVDKRMISFLGGNLFETDKD